jgi:hypothetical protein
MTNLKFLAVTALAAGALTLGAVACGSDVDDDSTTGGGGSGTSGPTHGSSASNAADAKDEDQTVNLPAAVSATGVEQTNITDVACDDTTNGIGYCNVDGITVTYCTTGKWYAAACPSGSFCGESDKVVSCYAETTTGAGGSGGSGGSTGTAGSGGSGGGEPVPGVLKFTGSDTDACHKCAADKCLTEAQGCDATGGDNANCKTTAECIAADMTANPDNNLDCNVEACNAEVIAEPKANEFLICLSKSCGTECEATEMFMNTANCK